MNEHFSVNIDDLRDRHREKINIRTRVYEKLLEKCYYRVNNAAENDLTYCIFPVPDFILGMPTYNLAYCAAYIIFDLKRNGFHAKFFNPNIIFVVWNYDKPSYFGSDTKYLSENKKNFKMIMPPSANEIKNPKVVTGNHKIIEIPTEQSIMNRRTTNYGIYNNHNQNNYQNQNNNFGKKYNEKPRRQMDSYRSINDYKPSGNFIYHN